MRQPEAVSQENTRLKKLLNMSVNEIELSVRAANCLNNANITTVGQLAQKSETEMLKYQQLRQEVAERDQGQTPATRTRPRPEVSRPGLVESVPAVEANA